MPGRGVSPQTSPIDLSPPQAAREGYLSSYDISVYLAPILYMVESLLWLDPFAAKDLLLFIIWQLAFLHN